MHLKINLLLFTILILSVLSACTTGINFNPDWHLGDSQQMAIVPEDGPIIMCESEHFDNYACMHKEKVKELKEILQRARLPQEDKLKLLKALDRALGPHL